ncbi:MAG: ABC transporter permease subunit [Myxococcales bacterium]|nr:ABC transporter permease subunit [Myxococcales bacterium]
MRRQAARAVTSPRRPSCAVWGALAVPLALLFGLGATPARAEGGVRYTTVFEELEGDAPRASSAAELAAIEAMRRAGVVFIDEAQARRIRSVNDAGALVAGQVSPVITPADADVLIAARCRLSPVTSALTSGTAYRYEARLEAKVIDVGTGQVLGAHFAAGQSRLRFSPDQALEEAARDAGARPLRVFFTVTLPLALPGILVAAIMSFLASFDEAQGTYLIGAPDYMTMPTQMYSLVLNYPKQVAAVFSLMLSAPSVLLLLLVRKQVMGGRLAEGFQIR